jgi:hypothetical protein
MSEELDHLWDSIFEINPRPRDPKWHTNDAIHETMRRLHLPRRHDSDVYLTSNGHEYWAGSVELYWLHSGDRNKLKDYLTDPEIDVLQALFDRIY